MSGETMINKFKRNRRLILTAIAILSILTFVFGDLPITTFISY